jgi:hypothetical protein
MSINQFGAVACFEFTKYSSCFGVISEVSVDLNATIIEVSPTPSGGILILGLNNSSDSAEKFNIFYQSQLTLSKSSLINSCLILNPDPQILKTYLSQNSVPEINNLSFYETNSICDGFVTANELTNLGARLIDFRILRSAHNRSILVFTNDDQPIHSKNTVVINKPNDLVKSYFQVLK